MALMLQASESVIGLIRACSEPLLELTSVVQKVHVSLRLFDRWTLCAFLKEHILARYHVDIAFTSVGPYNIHYPILIFQVRNPL